MAHLVKKVATAGEDAELASASKLAAALTAKVRRRRGTGAQLAACSCRMRSHAAGTRQRSMGCCAASAYARFGSSCRARSSNGDTLVCTKSKNS